MIDYFRRKDNSSRVSPTPVHDVINLILTSPIEKQPFFSEFDKEVARSLGKHLNSTRELLRIASPALLSLALCPATLYMYEPLVDVFWPASDGFDSQPDINEAIACFLAPAGLVYATSFGFAFQQALSKQIEVMTRVAHEIGLLDQIATLTSKLDMANWRQRSEIYRAVKAEAIFMILQLERKQPKDFVNVPLEDVKSKLLLYCFNCYHDCVQMICVLQFKYGAFWMCFGHFHVAHPHKRRSTWTACLRTQSSHTCCN